MSNRYQAWFYKKTRKTYADISSTFMGLGTVLFDGDALLQHILGAEPNTHKSSDLASNLHKAMLKFVAKLAKSGLDRVTLVFFHAHSAFTALDSNNNVQVAPGVDRVLEKMSYAVFTDWKNDLKWSEFIRHEHISCLVTNKSQYELVYMTCMLGKIQVCLLDYFDFTNLGIFSFIVHPLIGNQDPVSVDSSKNVAPASLG